MRLSDIMIWIVVGVAVNFIVGGIVFVSIDDKEQTLFKWYESCPSKIAWFAQPGVLFFWPIVVWYWYKNGNGSRSR